MLFKSRGSAAAIPSADEDSTCSYSSLFRTRCIDGVCQEEFERFRSCPGRPKERLVTDASSGQERWVAAGPEDEVRQGQTRAGRRAGRSKSAKREYLRVLTCVLSLLVSFLQSLFPPVSIPSAFGDLFSEVLPEFNRLHTHLQSDPILGQFLADSQLYLPRPYLPPVSHHRQPRMTREEIDWLGATSGADQLPPTALASDPITRTDASATSSIFNIANSVNAFVTSMNRLAAASRSCS